MTLQEAREKIASDNGHGSWNICVWRETLTSILLLDEKACELYAQSQVNDALDKAIIMVENNGDYTVEDGKVYISEESIIEELKRMKR